MMFIQLTYLNGAPALINFNNIRTIDILNTGGTGTRIVFDENHAYVVKETIEQVKAAIPCFLGTVG